MSMWAEKCFTNNTASYIKKYYL